MSKDALDELQKKFFKIVRASEGIPGGNCFLALIGEAQKEQEALRKSIRTMFCWLEQCGLGPEKLAFLARRPEVHRALEEAEHTKGMTVL